jgi:hypothetical protein
MGACNLGRTMEICVRHLTEARLRTGGSDPLG